MDVELEVWSGVGVASLRNVEIQVDAHALEAHRSHQTVVPCSSTQATSPPTRDLYFCPRASPSQPGSLTNDPLNVRTPQTRLNLYSPDITMSDNLRLSTTPVDRRFPNVNQAQHCWYVRSLKRTLPPAPAFRPVHNPPAPLGPPHQ
jgi:hypothetical protein